ncbi:hypothetical protein L1987_66799 [Smallanthus sonchifolius]|uniref:Uncharacterized protein n=1 Tax=Smallanthus sonchifolius TaxID=185202 RepID=A0ACB9BY52_9ASTR|nr:hypothetical protein L1987_66799 [Smallanthus sonchifolius]
MFVKQMNFPANHVPKNYRNALPVQERNAPSKLMQPKLCSVTVNPTRMPTLRFHVGANRKLDATVKALDSFLGQALDDRLAKISSLETKHEDGEGAEPLIDVLLLNKKSDDIRLTLDRDTMKALLLDMYVAGTQTTAALLEWSVAELLANPHVLKKLTTEIRTIVKDKQVITNDELDQIEYLKAVVTEAARLHPPGPVLSTRITTEDVNVMGYDIAKGTRVYINAWAIGRDPKVWDRPNEFMPERFMGDSISFLKHDFKLLTFGAGRRGCSGKTFALAVIEHFIANMLCKFDLVLPDGVTKDDVDLTETIGLSNRPKFPLLALVKPRT